MDDVAERIGRLRRMTPREREAFALLCAGLSHADIAARMYCSKSTVLFHLSNVYDKLGLGGMPMAVRQREVGKFCLAFREMGREDQTVPSPLEAEPESEVGIETEQGPDLTSVPQRALVAVLRDDDARAGAAPLPPFEETAERPILPSRSPRWLRPLLILLGTAIVGGVVGAAITALVLDAGRASLVREVVVTATPNPTASSVTAIISAETPPATASVPTAPPTATVPPSPAPPPTATALTGQQELAGKVPGDIPGVLVAPGTTISSVVEEHTKPRDVYAIQLAAGQTLQMSVTVKSGLFAYSLQVASPDSVSFAPGAWHGPTLCRFDNISCTESYAPAVTGTYYVAVVAETSTVPYVLRLTAR